MADGYDLAEAKREVLAIMAKAIEAQAKERRRRGPILPAYDERVAWSGLLRALDLALDALVMLQRGKHPEAAAVYATILDPLHRAVDDVAHIGPPAESRGTRPPHPCRERRAGTNVVDLFPHPR